MSKRAGEFITLDELLAEVGVDAARWYFASRGPRAPSTSTSSSRRSSRTRTPSITSSTRTRASRRSCARRPSRAPAGDDRGRHARRRPEALLARAVVRLPEVVEDAVAAEETHGITAYATELATTFHAFYRDARVVDPDAPERSAARLALARATQVTLANTLGVARDLRARRRCRRRAPAGAGQPAGPQRRRATRAETAASLPMTTHRVVPPVPGSTFAGPPAAPRAVVAAVSNAAASAAVSHSVCQAIAQRRRGPRGPPGGRRPSRRPHRVGRAGSRTPARASQTRAGTRRRCPGGSPSSPCRDPCRQGGRDGDLDGRLPRVVLLGVEDLLGRHGQAVVEASTPGQPPGALGRQERQARSCTGRAGLSRRMRRRLRRVTACGAGSSRRRMTSCSSCGLRLAAAPIAS